MPAGPGQLRPGRHVWLSAGGSRGISDVQMPYTFGVEMMGDRATLRDDLIPWNDTPADLEALRRACPFDGVTGGLFHGGTSRVAAIAHA